MYCVKEHKYIGIHSTHTIWWECVIPKLKENHTLLKNVS